jgi:hypothetical protein
VTRRAIAAAAIVLTAVIALCLIAVRDGALRRSQPGAPTAPRIERRSLDPDAAARLQAVPLYRALIRAEGLRSGAVDGDGTVHLDVDVRRLVEPRLRSLGLAGLAGLLPASAQGTIVFVAEPGAALPTELSESWLIPGPVPALDILDRAPPTGDSTLAADALPGSPVAVVRARLVASRLADESFGGPAFAVWRDRAQFAEKLFGRPFRAELAEDLAGPAVFALYETANGGGAEAVLAVELRRSDRIAGMLDTLFGLGALTERATIDRYRGVATGSFASDSGGPGLALAVDGPVLLIASSRARLESAIDARRSGSGRRLDQTGEGEAGASWSAVSASGFAARGWCRLARCTGEPGPPTAPIVAVLRPEGRFDWRLVGHGPSPAITADPLVPFLATVLAGRYRGGE